MFVWASPTYTQYSIARSKAKKPMGLIGADIIAQACMNITDCMRTDRFEMENHFTSMLMGRDVVASWQHYLKRTTYCKIEFNYKKETCIWTNATINLPACSRLTPCECSRASGGRNYPEAAQQVYSGSRSTLGQNTTHVLHRVPAGFVALLTS